MNILETCRMMWVLIVFAVDTILLGRIWFNFYDYNHWDYIIMFLLLMQFIVFTDFCWF